jgi:hypothetical protein
VSGTVSVQNRGIVPDACLVLDVRSMAGENAGMGRPLRTQVGGLLYHGLNRANQRALLFGEPGDYLAFLQTMAEAQAGPGP